MIMVSRGLSLSRNILRGLRGLRVRQTRLASTPASGGGFGPPKPTPSIFEQAKLNDMKTIQESYSQIQRGAVSDGKERSSSVLEDTVQFPSAFTIKVIGVNEPAFAPDIVSLVTAELGMLPEKMKVSLLETSGGKYVSVTLVADYQSADEVYAAYKVIGDDARVKYVI